MTNRPELILTGWDNLLDSELVAITNMLADWIYPRHCMLGLNINFSKPNSHNTGYYNKYCVSCYLTKIKFNPFAAKGHVAYYSVCELLWGNKVSPEELKELVEHEQDKRK